LAVRLSLLIMECRDDLGVAIGLADRQTRFDDAALLLGEQLSAGSVYRLLAEHGDRLFGDGHFVDLFIRSRLGRPTVGVTGSRSICGGRRRRVCRSGRGHFIRRCWS
jgi:hypothetical protein